MRLLANLALGCCEDDLEGIGRREGYGRSESGSQGEPVVLLTMSIKPLDRTCECLLLLSTTTYASTLLLNCERGIFEAPAGAVRSRCSRQNR